MLEQTIDGHGVLVPAKLEARRLGHGGGAGDREDARKRTKASELGLAVETWYLAKKHLANQAK
ncbi:MAG: hypothetical protein WCD57_13295 [Acidobacteriaceae bacterium]